MDEENSHSNEGIFFCQRGLKNNHNNDDEDEEEDNDSASNNQERPVVNTDDAPDIGAEFLDTLEEAASASQDDEEV